MLTVDKTSVEISVTFRPLLQNGLLLLLTTADQFTAIFTVGIFNGEVHTYLKLNMILYL